MSQNILFESGHGKLKELHQQVENYVFLVKCSCAYQTPRSYLNIAVQSDVPIREASQGLKESYPLVYLKLLCHRLTEEQSGKHHIHQLFDSSGWSSVGRPMSTMQGIFYIISSPLTASSASRLVLRIVIRVVTNPTL